MGVNGVFSDIVVPAVAVDVKNPNEFEPRPASTKLDKQRLVLAIKLLLITFCPPPCAI